MIEPYEDNLYPVDTGESYPKSVGEEETKRLKQGFLRSISGPSNKIKQSFSRSKSSSNQQRNNHDDNNNDLSDIYDNSDHNRKDEGRNFIGGVLARINGGSKGKSSSNNKVKSKYENENQQQFYSYKTPSETYKDIMKSSKTPDFGDTDCNNVILDDDNNGSKNGTTESFVNEYRTSRRVVEDDDISYISTKSYASSKSRSGKKEKRKKLKRATSEKYMKKKSSTTTRDLSARPKLNKSLSAKSMKRNTLKAPTFVKRNAGLNDALPDVI